MKSFRELATGMSQIWGWSSPTGKSSISIYQAEGDSVQLISARNSDGVVSSVEITLSARLDMSRALMGKQSFKALSDEEKVSLAQAVLEGTKYVVAYPSDEKAPN